MKNNNEMLQNHNSRLIELEKTNESHNPVVHNDAPCTRSTHTSLNTDSTESLPIVASAPPMVPMTSQLLINDIVINHHTYVTVRPSDDQGRQTGGG